ncbi:MAG: hypothetical protein EOO73_08235 [Myxococcales bacterium]|nr:MAG: hypothetical protein EOO73_08235 [Myxococcales bacterium]
MSARVGEVRGEFHAEFSLVRADDGQQRLDLTLHEGAKEVLKRELPLGATGCQDAAQTIALILERYFDAIERPPVVATPAPAEGVPAPLPGPRPDARVSDRGVVTAPSSAPLGIEARGGALYDHEFGLAAVVGASFYPAPLRVSSSWRVGFGLEVAPFFARQTDMFREKQVEAFLLQGALLVPLTWTRSRWLASAGPWLQLRFQRAEAPSVVNNESAFRTIPGLGGFVRAGVDLTASLGLSAGVAAGPQLRGAASRLVLDGAAGQIAVLVPDAWFVHGQLALELRL